MISSFAPYLIEKSLFRQISDPEGQHSDRHDRARSWKAEGCDGKKIRKGQAENGCHLKEAIFLNELNFISYIDFI